MRQTFNLDLQSLDRFMDLVYGAYSVGKTFHLGDFLLHEVKQGPALFINIAGQDGQLAVAHMGLDGAGVKGWTLETYKDVLEAVDELTAHPVHALGIDGVKEMAWGAVFHELGEERLPLINLSKEGEGPQKNEWGDVHLAAGRLYRRLRACAKIVMANAPADMSVDNLTDKKKRWIVPDLPGKQSFDIIGYFDFVGYMSAKVMSPGVLRRTITYTPNEVSRVRARLPRAITRDIEVPIGPGGWAKVKGIFEEHLQKEVTPAK